MDITTRGHPRVILAPEMHRKYTSKTFPTRVIVILVVPLLTLVLLRIVIVVRLVILS